MPELPEVETFVRELEPDLAGRKVVDAAVHWSKIIAVPTAEEFCQQIVGEEFVSFGRRAKYMLLGLSSGATLIVHLRMTGHLHVLPADAQPDKHTHVVIRLDDGHTLHYQDPRKFGRLWLVGDVEPILSKLSAEPLSAEFTTKWLSQRLQSRNAPIKALLLDQTISAGVGNIYADEALHLAGIHPTRPGASLKPGEIKKLHAAIRTVLQQGIAKHGSSLGGSVLTNYRRPNGELKQMQDEFQVYGREGEPCHTCGKPIERLVIAQRSSHFCGKCQK